MNVFYMKFCNYYIKQGVKIYFSRLELPEISKLQEAVDEIGKDLARQEEILAQLRQHVREILTLCTQSLTSHPLWYFL